MKTSNDIKIVKKLPIIAQEKTNNDKGKKMRGILISLFKNILRIS